MVAVPLNTLQHNTRLQCSTLRSNTLRLHQFNQVAVAHAVQPRLMNQAVFKQEEPLGKRAYPTTEEWACSSKTKAKHVRNRLAWAVEEEHVLSIDLLARITQMT